MKTCTKCYRTKPLDDFYSSGGWCRSCKKEYQAERYRSDIERHRAWQRAYSKTERRRSQRRGEVGVEYRRRNHKECLARSMLNNEIAAGRIVRPDTCPHCNDPDRLVEAHHPDYAKPLEVEWACLRCHRKIEGRYIDG